MEYLREITYFFVTLSMMYIVNVSRLVDVCLRGLLTTHGRYCWAKDQPYPLYQDHGTQDIPTLSCAFTLWQAAESSTFTTYTKLTAPLYASRPRKLQSATSKRFHVFTG